MKQIKHKHPLAIRWFHWFNFPILIVMIWSGLMIYWANDVYQVAIGGKQLIKFFPQSFYEALNLKYSLGRGMALHFVFLWLFAINGFLYVTYTIFSGEYKYLKPTKNSFKEAWLVIKHDLWLTKDKPHVKKYNGAQQLAYLAIILMGFGSLLTGLAIYKPIQFSWLCFLMGGYEFARVLHFILTIGYVIFFVVHILQVIRAGWNNFSAMVSGFEVENVADIQTKNENNIN